MAPRKANNKLSQLINQRVNAVANIERIYDFVCKNSVILSVDDLECRLEILETYFNETLAFQVSIEELEFDAENVNSVQVRGEIEELYCKCKVKIKKLIQQCEKVEKSVKLVQETSSAHRHEHLPKLKLPTFSGEYSEFPNFMRLFTQLVHEESRLSKIEKFNHLLSCLSDSALRTIKALDVTDENYETAIELLRKRFDNKYLLCQDHIRNLFRLKKVQKESPQQLRALIDAVATHFNALQTLLTHEEIANAFIVHSVVSSLDSDSQAKVEEKIDCKKAFNWNDCAQILEHRCQILETRDLKINIFDQKQRQPNKHSDKAIKSVALTSVNKSCSCCKQNDHAIWQCSKFLSLDPVQRFNEAKSAGLCINCLSSQHTTRDCKASCCKHCKGRHNSMLHRKVNSPHTQQQQLPYQQLSHQTQQPYEQHHQQQQLHQLQHQLPTSNTNNISTSMVSQQYGDNNPDRIQSISATEHTILATAVVKIFDKYGKTHFARVLLDSGSQVNFLCKNLAQRLNLDNIKTNAVIGGIGESHTKSNFCTNAIISSCVSDFTTQLNLFILPTITGQQPDSEINIQGWPIPSNITLADPSFNVPQKIDMLIGADLFFILFTGQQMCLGPNYPTLMQTKLGWIISGRCKLNEKSYTSLISSKINATQFMQLENQVKQFWEIEKVPEAKRKLSRECSECEIHFAKYMQRDPSGRFRVKLPLKSDSNVLGNSKTMAIRRFLNLEKRLLVNAPLNQAYLEFMNQYESQGHMERVPWSSAEEGSYIIPHHCVLRPEKSTTKCRVVFDASAKTTNNISLNDILMTGPVVQNELYDILLRFRLHKYGIMADITAMYRQINVYAEDYKVQNIIWRRSPSEELQLYNLKTVTYGTTPAPYLATRCLVELANHAAKNNSKIGKIVKTDFYVDDLISGASSLEELVFIKEGVTSLLKEGQFQLHKWHSNHQQFLDSIPEEDREKPIQLNNAHVVKALGIIWDSNSDCFKFKYISDAQSETSITKRSVLSQLSRLFDPLGLVNPVIVKAKVFLQELWMNDFDWDQAIPSDLANSWINFAKDLENINTIKIPRYVLIENSAIQLHGFSDASTRAYGCCFYLKCIDSLGNVDVNLFTAKSKVAPISVTRSIPALELCAAQLMVQVYDKIRDSIMVSDVIFWSDSIIVLSWLSEYASSLNTFVANRVSYIQEKSAEIKWQYVPTAQNPADIVSRGATIQELSSSIWFTGPEFLHSSDNLFPEQPKRLSSSELPERKIQKSILLAVNNQQPLLDNIYACSDFTKICRRFAYIRRFLINLRNPQNRSSHQTLMLSVNEIDDAFLNIIQLIQQSHYRTEIMQLERNKQLNANNMLRSLNPFLENENGFVLLKVGGRLKKSALPYETKCPIILPKSNLFVQCYVRHLHIANFHAGAQSLVGIIRRRFWIISAREYARKIVKKCVHCFKYKPKLLTQLMADLPKDRLTPVSPFTHCGVDFCGPIMTTLGIRGKPKYKSYIAVFICFATRAVHMEVVSDLTSNAFLAALKRFIGRRGLCSTLYLDNATNFVGAHNQLKEFKKVFLSQQNQHELASWCTSNEIEFKHIPPRSPHFGGLWEAAVKSAKTILYKVMQSAVLTFEELTTVVVQIEGILNSRPLTALSTDPSDEQPLTPSHFLNTSKLETIVEPRLSLNKISLLKRFQQISAIQQHFWARWSKEFLVTLQQRRKWDTSIPNIQPEILVMIHDDNLPPQKWLIGRVTQVFKGSDGKVRVAEVKTPAGLFKRAITKLAALPIENEFG